MAKFGVLILPRPEAPREAKLLLDYVCLTIGPLGVTDEDKRGVLKTLAERVLPAHGAVYKDHRYRAHQLIQHHEYRKQEMHDTIRRQAKTAYEIALEVFGSGDNRPIFHTIAATFETLTHLHLLLYEGKVRRLEEGGPIRFLAQ